jgi:hypothetical protein
MVEECNTRTQRVDFARYQPGRNGGGKVLAIGTGLPALWRRCLTASPEDECSSAFNISGARLLAGRANPAD